MGKSVKNAILIILILSLSISTALLAYLHFFAAGDDNLTGEWTADIDMTKQAAVTAYSWLRDIEGVAVSVDEIESYMQGLTVQVKMTMEQTSRSEGAFQCNVLTESHEACNKAAYEALAKIFKELVVKRLYMAGYEGETGSEDIETLIVETFGMSTVSYLKACVPDLLPSLEGLRSWYDGSGTYKMSEGVLTRYFEGRDYIRTERCILHDSSLILYEATGLTAQDSYSDSGVQNPPSAVNDDFSDYYPVMYTLKQIKEQ